MRIRALTLALLSSLGITCLAAPARAQQPNPRDYDIVRRVPREEADRWLKDELRRSGAKLDRERYHYVLAFSTGHYGSDPVHAIAMRRLAFSWLNNSFAAGDRVTPAAWEMKLWDLGQPITLTEDPLTRAAFVDAVPYAPQPGSRGGHDTEGSLFEAVQRAVPKELAPSTVVLMVTNTNQSQVPTGSRDRLFGASNPELSAAIRQGGFRAPVRHTFTAEGKSGPLTIDVTALFPVQARGIAGAPDSPRYPTFPLESWQPAADRPPSSGDLPNPPSSSGPTLQTDRKITVKPEGEFPWPWILGAVLAAVALALFLMTRRKPAAEAKEQPPAVKGRPLPGSLRATVGRGAAAKTVTLTSLTSASQWALMRGESGMTLEKVDEEIASGKDASSGTLLARLTLDERGLLRLTADPNAHLKLTAGQNSEGDSRELRLRRDGRLLCEVHSATAASAPERLELVYASK